MSNGLFKYYEKNPVIIEYEKYMQLNTKTKSFISETSSKSYKLFLSLTQINRKDFNIDDIKRNDRIDIINKEDIMDSVCCIYDSKPENFKSKLYLGYIYKHLKIRF